MRKIQLLVIAVVLFAPLSGWCAVPTSGDALWDAYAQLLEDALTRPDLEQAVGAYKQMLLGRSPLVPRAPFQTLALVSTDKLDALEPRFADDPRYWQLRYFEARRHLPPGRVAAADEAAAVDWLRQGQARGATDFATDWFLLKRQLAAQRSSADASGWQAVEQRIRQTLEAFIAKYPDESVGYYENAMFHFELGEWDEGLAALETGNQAANNTCPRMFPISFIMHCALADEPVGSEAAAGIITVQWGAMTADSFYDVIGSKDHVKEEQVRLELGAPYSEIGPWHRYCCRLSTQQQGGPLEGYLGMVFDGVLVGSLFVDFADSFTVRQRAELRALDSHLKTYRTNLAVGLASNGAQYPMADSLLGLDADKLQEQFRNAYRRFAGEVKVTQRQGLTMSWLSRFDWGNILMPPNDLPQDVEINDVELGIMYGP